MDDIWQIIVYAAFFIIYLISKVLNNKKKQPVTRMPEEETERDFSDPDRPRRSPEVDLGESRSGGSRSREGRSGMDELPRRKKSGTFGKVLRDFTDTKKEEAYYRKKEREIQTQRRNAQQKADEVERQLVQQKKVYTDKASDAMRQIQKPTQSIDKVREIDNMTQGLRRMLPYQKKKNNTTARNIARTLKNPETARHAVILAEIFNRKHF